MVSNGTPVLCFFSELNRISVVCWFWMSERASERELIGPNLGILFEGN